MSIRKKKAEAIIGGLMIDLAASGAFDALAIVRHASMRTGSAASVVAPDDPAWAELARELIIVKETVPFFSGDVERLHIRSLESAIKGRTAAVPALVEKLDGAIDSNKSNYDNTDIQVAKDAITKMKIAAKRIGSPAVLQESGDAGTTEKAFDEYITKGAKELEAFFDKYKIEDDPKGEYWSEPHFNIAKNHLLDDKNVQKLMSHYNKKGDAKARLMARPGFPQGAFELYKHVSAQIKKASAELDKLGSHI